MLFYKNNTIPKAAFDAFECIHLFNRRLQSLLVLILTLTLVSSCSLKKHATKNISQESIHAVKSALYSQYNHWKGTPYMNGGLSKGGIDCSGFVMLIFKEQFNIQLPRSTRDQASLGHPVGIDSLLPGDLLFFDTGWFSTHVGIYLEQGSFIHASTSKGVTLSSLKNVYWRKALSRAKRHYLW